MNIPSRSELLKSYSSKKNIIRFTGLALLIRVVVLGYFIFQSHQLYPERLIDGFVFKMNDYEYFLGTVDNYMEKGTMTYLDQAKPFAGRMPGYGFPYLVIRLFTGQAVGLAILIIIQVVMGALSTYLLALIALMIFNDTRISKAVFWCFAICAPVAIFDIFTLAESFSISVIICFHFFLFRYCLDAKTKDLLLSGFFMAWAIFLRPFLGSLILVTPLFIMLFQLKKVGLGTVITNSIILMVPFIIFETAWVTRNYLALGRFIPLETSLSESYGEDGAYRTSAIGIRTMINSWGGETGEFYDGSEDWWFHHAEGQLIEQYAFQPHVFKGPFTRDSLVALKLIFNQSINPDLSAGTRDSLNQLANRIALRYAAGYKEENPLRYHLLNPLKMYGRQLLSNGTRLLIMPAVSKMNFFQKCIKGFYMLFYYGFIIAGTAGMIVFLLRGRPYAGNSLLMLAFPWIIATTVVFYASFVIIEYRYMISAYSIYILFGVYGLFNLPFLKKTAIHTHSG